MNTKKRLSPEADGGLASRKLWLAVFAMLVVTGLGALTLVSEAVVATLPSVTAAIVALYAAYVGANVSTKWVIGRAPRKKKKKIQPKFEE